VTGDADGTSVSFTSAPQIKVVGGKVQAEPITDLAHPNKTKSTNGNRAPPPSAPIPVAPIGQNCDGGSHGICLPDAGSPTEPVAPTAPNPDASGGGGRQGPPTITGAPADDDCDPSDDDCGDEATEGATGSGPSLFGNLTHAGDGIKPYSVQSGVTAGQRGTIQAHHLIEKRFSDVMGGNTNDWATIVVTRAEHQVFTNAWRQAIPYGAGTRSASRATVEAAARRIYSGYPEILKALGLG
jgi:hypothetical protein